MRGLRFLEPGDFKVLNRSLDLKVIKYLRSIIELLKMILQMSVGEAMIWESAAMFSIGLATQFPALCRMPQHRVLPWSQAFCPIYHSRVGIQRKQNLNITFRFCYILFLYIAEIQCEGTSFSSDETFNLTRIHVWISFTDSLYSLKYHCL